MATALQTHELEVTRLSGSLGAEIRGLRLSDAGPDDADAIQSLLSEHRTSTLLSATSSAGSRGTRIYRSTPNGPSFSS